jgi:glycosyltransferase A (GT-A) superfamily protein (DUF2064 family)
VVAIGADSPTLPVEYVRRAFELLVERPVVLGPARDGGYYLVGASEDVPPIFSDIDWGTARVWQQTVTRLNESRIPFHELPPWYDIDTARDLKLAKRDGFAY